MRALVTLGRTLTPSSRAAVAAVFVAAVVSKIVVVTTALAVDAGAARRAVVLGVVAAGVLLVQRAASTRARVSIACDLFRGAVRAVLEGDVIATPEGDLERAVFEGAHHAQALLAATAPLLVADIVAAAALAPIVSGTFSTAVLELAAGVLVVVVASLALLRGPIRRSQTSAAAAEEALADRVLGAVRARVEIVAQAGEEAHLRETEVRIDDYRRTAGRAALGAAVFGRLPIAVGALAVALVVLLDAGARDAVLAAALGRALVLAALAPIVLGAILGSADIVRAGARVVGLVTLLERERRVARAGAGGTCCLPASVRFEAVSFRYASNGPCVLDRVSFTWEPSVPLVVVGDNGAGKSTLLRMLVGLGAPLSGRIRLGDTPFDTVDLRAHRRAVAYLPQRPYLGQVHADVRSAMRLGVFDATDDQILDALDQTGLRAALSARAAHAPLSVCVSELSSGQRQRLALARILLRREAKLVVLDEPDANLDGAGVALVATLVRGLVRDGKQVAISVHDAALEGVGQRVELPTPGAPRR